MTENTIKSANAASKSLPLSKMHEQAFLTLIQDQLGITIHKHQYNELHKTIQHACEKFAMNPKDYLKKLSTSQQDSPYYEELIKGITIGETYFFRDKNQMRLLNDTILPNIIAKKREEKHLSISVWSAGSASGEEIYTIAMMLDRLLPDISHWTLNLLGTDINIHSLKKAITGIYGTWSMRSIPHDLKKRYFTHNKNQYQLVEDIKNRVRFEYLNLNDNLYPSISNGTNAQDLILCRNVLIYFDMKSTENVMRKLSASLANEGYLMLGASDPIIKSIPHLAYHFQHGAYFQRTIQQCMAQEPSIKPVVSTTIKPNIPIKKAKIAVPITKAIHNTARATIINLINEAQFEAALSHLESDSFAPADKAFVLGARATAYANLGKLDLAARCCEQCLAIEPTNLQTYFTLAMILLEMNQLDEAERALRKVLFLDNEFILGHYQLGLLLLRNKKIEPGIKCLKNALAMVKKMPPHAHPIGFEQLDLNELQKTLENEIALHGQSGENSSYE